MGRGGAQDMTALRTGTMAEYLAGLNNLRRMVASFETDLNKASLEFYQCEANDEDQYQAYLKTCNEQLLYCNSQLRRNDVELEVIDGELRLVSLLNKMRELDPERTDQDTIGSLTEFWEHLKDSLDRVRTLCGSYKIGVFKRLRASCTGRQNGYITLPVTKVYLREVANYESQIRNRLRQFDSLLKSFANGMRREVASEPTFTNRILIMCDQKAFPILRFYPDLTEKLTQICKLSRLWIDRDEAYVLSISQRIRDTRHQTKKKALRLRNQREARTQKSKSVEEAYDLFKSNKQALAKIETELRTLEEQSRQQAQDKYFKLEEKRQKEGIVGFLEISITQTKKNVNLQLKRSRIMRQLRELEASIAGIEQEISTLEGARNAKWVEKAAAAEQVRESSAAYWTLKADLDKFNTEVGQLQKDMHELTDLLTQLEIVQSCKTSPEAVDDFYERPSTVKLAPSLKEKIAKKRGRMVRQKTVTKSGAMTSRENTSRIPVLLKQSH